MIRSRALRTVAVIASALTSGSCGDFTDSTSPGAAHQAVLSLPTKTVTAGFTYLSAGTKAKAVRWGASHVATEERISAVVGSEGATLTLPGADFLMTIPAGALADPTVITLTSKGGSHVAYDMQPHGLVFLKPVTVVQDLGNTAPYGTSGGNGIRSAYLPDGKEEIEPDDSATPAEVAAGATLFSGTDGVAETHVWYLSHFSRYILISGIWVLEAE